MPRSLGVSTARGTGRLSLVEEASLRDALAAAVGCDVARARHWVSTIDRYLDSAYVEVDPELVWAHLDDLADLTAFAEHVAADLPASADD